MKILGIIPARGGSKRIPHKNKTKLNGKELVRYSIEAAKQSKLLTHIVVSSDDDMILSIASTYNEVESLRRPDEISGDKALAIAYVEHALNNFEESYDLVVIIQPSSPLTTGADIDNTIDLLIQTESDSSVSVCKLDHAIHPVKMKTLSHEDILLPFIEEEKGRMAAHELPELYVRNCSVYVSTIHVIQSGRIIGDKCSGYKMPRERSIDINDPLDLEFAEFLLMKNNGK